MTITQETAVINELPERVRVPILTYHHISDTPTSSPGSDFFVAPTVFEQQMAYLADNPDELSFISAIEAALALSLSGFLAADKTPENNTPENNENSTADALSAVAIIAIPWVAVIYWLSGLPTS